MGEQTFVQIILVTWPGCQYMVKAFKRLLLWNRLAVNGRCRWNLVYSIGHSSTTKFFQMMTLGWHLAFLREGQRWFHMYLYKTTLIWILKKIRVVHRNRLTLLIPLLCGPYYLFQTSEMSSVACIRFTIVMKQFAKIYIRDLSCLPAGGLLSSEGGLLTFTQEISGNS